MESFIKKNSKQTIFIILAITIVIMLFPLFQHGIIPGDDWQYHLSRIENIKESILAGIFPAKIHPISNNSYGYGSGLFYPNLFLYIPSILTAFFFSLSFSYKIFILLILLTTVSSTYFSTKYIFKSRYAGLIASVMFITSQAMISNIYYRFALGEVIAAIFIPIGICGLYNLIYEEYSKPWILILSVLGLIYSHTISLFLMIIVFFFIFMINIKKNFKTNPQKILIKIIISSIIVLLLSISFWLPMIEQLVSDKFFSYKSLFYLSDYSINFFKLISPNQSPAGIILFITVILCIFTFKKIKVYKIQYNFIFIGIFLFLLTSNIFPWHLFDNTFLNFIQFPWRFLPLASAFIAIGIGGLAKIFLNKYLAKVVLFIFIFLLTIGFTLNAFNKIPFEAIPIPDNIANLPVSLGAGREWLPYGTKLELLTSPDTIFTDNNITYRGEREKYKVIFEYDSSNNNSYFDIPLIYYKGYRAKLITENGKIKELKVIKSENNNLVRVMNENNESGKIIVGYFGTTIQHISYFINFLTLLILIFYLIKKEFYKPVIHKHDNKYKSN